MITLDHFPENKEQFIRLIGFLKEVLELLDDLCISPILNGSLAVLAYTQDQDMSVHDVDLPCSEAEFSRIIDVLDEKGLSYRLKEWHVLQI